MNRPSITHLDLRGDQKNPPAPKVVAGRSVRLAKLTRGRVVERDPRTITGIGIHQTACVFGPAGSEARYQRALLVPSHALAFGDGVFATAWPLPWLVHHGNALNPFSYGLEVEGHHPGLPDDPETPTREDEETTWSTDPTPFDDLAIETARAALFWLVEEGSKLGSDIRYVWAHRQANGTKRSDPGHPIWKHVVLDYAVRMLGLRTQPARTWRDGRPVPVEWDPAGVGQYR